jgi:hypothetical protein
MHGSGTATSIRMVGRLVGRRCVVAMLGAASISSVGWWVSIAQPMVRRDARRVRPPGRGDCWIQMSRPVEPTGSGGNGATPDQQSVIDNHVQKASRIGGLIALNAIQQWASPDHLDRMQARWRAVAFSGSLRRVLKLLLQILEYSSVYGDPSICVGFTPICYGPRKIEPRVMAQGRRTPARIEANYCRDGLTARCGATANRT